MSQGRQALIILELLLIIAWLTVVIVVVEQFRWEWVQKMPDLFLSAMAWTSILSALDAAVAMLVVIFVVWQHLRRHEAKCSCSSRDDNTKGEEGNRHVQ